MAVTLPVTLQAAPADQWLVRDDRLVQMRQIERDSGAMLTISTLTAGDVSSSLAINAPDPPLGRNFDAGAERLWYANRDIDESDLVEMTLHQPQ